MSPVDGGHRVEYSDIFAGCTCGWALSADRDLAGPDDVAQLIIRWAARAHYHAHDNDHGRGAFHLMERVGGRTARDDPAWPDFYPTGWGPDDPYIPSG